MTTLTLTGNNTAPAKSDAALVADFFLENDEQLHHPILRKFDFMWRSLAQNGRLPGRQHMMHEDMMELLPHLMMLEVTGAAHSMRFRARLVGQHHVTMNGGNAAGQFLDEAGNDGRVGCVDQAAVVDVVASKTPLYVRYRMTVAPGQTIDCEAALYPLASDGMTIDRVAAVVVPDYPRPTRKARLLSWF
jgi:hypothetical protein